MRKAIRAFVLVMALAIPAFAGNIPYDVAPPPPPPPDATAQAGDMQNEVAGEIPNNATGNIPYDVTTSLVLVSLLVALIS